MRHDPDASRREMDDLRQQAQGKWPSILAAAGVEKAYLVNRHGPCPICRDGKDRFRFDDKDGRGTWFCSQCSGGRGGDGFALAQLVNNWSFRQTKEEIQRLVGTAKVAPIRLGRPPDQAREEMQEIWKLGRPIEAEPATANWWMNRVGVVPNFKTLRSRAVLKCPRFDPMPAQIAIVQDVDGRAATMHKTYLAQNGTKAAVPEPRRLHDLPTPPGCAVRLGNPEDVLGIAEGIETAVAASILFDVPCWAALNAGLLEKWRPPEGVRRVIIFGDNDLNYRGQNAAFHLANKLTLGGIEVSVEIPEEPGMDWNDIQRVRRGQFAEHAA